MSARRAATCISDLRRRRVWTIPGSGKPGRDVPPGTLKSVLRKAGLTLEGRTMDYTVVIEPADDGSYSAHVPDLPGWVPCGDTPGQAWDSIHEAIQGHIQT